MAGATKSEKVLAAQYQCAVRTVREWKAQGAPLEEPEKMAKWLDDRHKTNGMPVGSLGEAKIAKLRLECDRLTHQNAVARGEYTANAEIRRDMLRIGSATRAALQALKSDAPTWEGLPAAEIERRVDERIETICADLHRATSDLYGP